MKKKLKYIYKKIVEYVITNRLFLTYVIASIIGTTAVRWATIGNITNIYPFLTDLGVILILGGLGYFIKPKNQFKYFFTLLCIYTLAEVVNVIYFVFYVDFASFGDLATLEQAGAVTGSVTEKLRIEYFLYILLPALLYYIHNKLAKSSYYNYVGKVEKGKKMFFYTLLVGSFCLAISFGFAKPKDFSRLNKQWNRVSIVERFGVLLYEGNDLVQTLRPKFSSLFGYEEAKESFDAYFKSEYGNDYTEENSYTGILEGKNLIFVHMESIQTFLMDQTFNGGELTPNLNALAEEGMFFPNFYPQVSTGTSSDTEFTLLSSLMPVASGTVFISYNNRTYNTIPKYLTDAGYYTFSMHGNLASMWGRNKIHPKLGYQGLYFEESFEYTEEDVINLGISDMKFFEQAVGIIEGIEESYPNYMGTVITLSNHSPFSFQDKYGEFDFSETFTVLNEETGQYEEHTTNYIEGTEVGDYMSSVHYADKALGAFLEYVKNSEHFDDTVFIFYGDHDAKLTRKEIGYLYNHDKLTGDTLKEGDEGYVNYDSFTHDLNKKTPLIIWTKDPSLKHVFKGTVDYYMGMLDMQPTILNMLGLENEYALGHDIFTIKENNILPFPNGSFITNKLYYNNSTEESKVIDPNAIIEGDYIEKNKEYVDKLLEVSNSIIVYDLLSTKEKSDE